MCFGFDSLQTWNDSEYKATNDFGTADDFAIQVWINCKFQVRCKWENFSKLYKRLPL